MDPAPVDRPRAATPTQHPHPTPPRPTTTGTTPKAPTTSRRRMTDVDVAASAKKLPGNLTHWVGDTAPFPNLSQICPEPDSPAAAHGWAGSGNREGGLQA